MSWLKKIFGTKEIEIKGPENFWDWFTKHESSFFKAVKSEKNIEKVFFDPLGLKLRSIRNDDIYFVTGMFDDHRAELILSSEGTMSNIAFIEDLVSESPQLDNWIFTALKSESTIENVSIEMNDLSFNKETLGFKGIQNDRYPDEIVIKILHPTYDTSEPGKYEAGCFIFLDNYLGELSSLEQIDRCEFGKLNLNDPDVVPIEKLKDYLNWRTKEFIEKYESEFYDSTNDERVIMEYTDKSGFKITAVVNQEVLEWDNLSSHCWISEITFGYNGADNNGVPVSGNFDTIYDFVNTVNQQFPENNGNIEIARETGNNKVIQFFASREYRTASKVIDKAIRDFQSDYFTVSYEIYKDKYWKTFNPYK